MPHQHSVETLLAEEQELQFPWFDADVAWMLGTMIRERAHDSAMPIAIDISKNGQQLFFAALRGATPDNAEWIRRKRAVVQRFSGAGNSLQSGKAISFGPRRSTRSKFGLPSQPKPISGGMRPPSAPATGVAGVKRNSRPFACWATVSMVRWR